MRWFAAALILLALAAGAAGAAPPSTPGTLVLTRESGYRLPVRVNGRLLRLRVEPGLGGITLNPPAAAAAGLRGSLIEASAQVGPVRIRGESNLARIQIGRWKSNRRLIWFDRDIVEGADGLIGIAELPHASTILELAPPTEPQRSFEFPLRPASRIGPAYALAVGTSRIEIVFRLWQPLTQASAAAGAELARHHGGTWAGEPFRRPVLLGVERPVRPMAFGAPPSLGGLRLESLLVRTADFRGGYVLPSDGPGDEADPNEIVITGRAQRSRPLLVVSLGEDRLGRCSRLVYRRSNRVLTLTCPSTMAD